MAEASRLAEIQAAMQRWVAYVQNYHIDQWADDRQQMLADTETVWDRRLHAQESVGSVPAQLGYIQDFTRIQKENHTSREREDVTMPEGLRVGSYAWQTIRAAEMAAQDDDHERFAYQDQPSLMDRAREAAGYRNPPPEIGIDTNDPELGATWEAQLAALDARLDALSRESHQHAQRQGIGY
jgi:hypothetical protein